MAIGISLEWVKALGTAVAGVWGRISASERDQATRTAIGAIRYAASETRLYLTSIVRPHEVEEVKDVQHVRDAWKTAADATRPIDRLFADELDLRMFSWSDTPPWKPKEIEEALDHVNLIFHKASELQQASSKP